jgi:hypothetical protein
MPEPLRTLLAGPELQAGLLAGAAALILATALAVAWRAAGRQGPVPVVGLLMAAGGALALHARVSPAPGRLLRDPALPEGLAIGLVVLACAGLVVDLTGWPSTAAAVLAVPGALLIAATADLVDVGWVRLTVAGMIVLGGWCVASFDARWRRPPVAPALFVLSAVGIYFTVPDTEEAMVLLGVAVPLALLGWPLGLGALGTGGSFAATGLLCWTVAAGGYGRRSSIVGGLACLGLLVVEPVARLAAGRKWQDCGPVWGWSGAVTFAALPGAHLGLVYVASRVAGLRLTVAAALAIVALEAALAVGALLFVARLRHRRSTAIGPGVGAAP